MVIVNTSVCVFSHFSSLVSSSLSPSPLSPQPLSFLSLYPSVSLCLSLSIRLKCFQVLHPSEGVLPPFNNQSAWSNSHLTKQQETRSLLLGDTFRENQSIFSLNSDDHLSLLALNCCISLLSSSFSVFMYHLGMLSATRNTLSD